METCCITFKYCRNPYYEGSSTTGVGKELKVRFASCRNPYYEGSSTTGLRVMLERF